MRWDCVTVVGEEFRVVTCRCGGGDCWLHGRKQAAWVSLVYVRMVSGLAS